MEMRKCGVLALCLVVLLSTTACSAGRDISPTYPRIEYRNSSYNLDPRMMWWKPRTGMTLFSIS
jgi:hypothetical protein